MQKIKMSKYKFTKYSLLAVCMSLSSCVTSMNSEKVIGVKRGEKVKTVARSKMISGDISGWDSTWDVWFGSSHDKVELMPLDESAIYGMDVGRIPIGHEVEILKVKRYSWNHTVKVLAKLKKEGREYKVIIGSSNAREILGVN
jgi:hypothetical protein